ncbi:MAG: outer membrane protein assembly factor BamD, partial [Sphingobacteriales bacterium]
MHFRVKNLLFIFLSIILLSACTGYEKVLKSNDVNYKLVKGNEFYDKKLYPQANAIYESLLPVMKNTRNYEALYYKYAYSFYYMKDYLSASYHFKNFTEFFPTSKDAEEVEFMHALCLYRMSPKASMEQTYTAKALDALQNFINTHPDSKRLDEANKYVDECRKKLEEKQALAAELYYDIGQYRAAGIAYRALMRDYPESTSSDKYQYMIIKSWYNFAKVSIAEKQEERYATALNAYQELVD